MPIGNCDSCRAVEELQRHDMFCAVVRESQDGGAKGGVPSLSGVFITVPSETAAAKTWKEHNGRR